MSSPSSPRSARPRRDSDRAAELEALDLEKTAHGRELAELAQVVVQQHLGKLVDLARERDDLVIDEENTAVRRLVDLTGRKQSGTMPVAQPSATEPCPPPSVRPEGPITRRPSQLDTQPRVERVIVVDDEADIAESIAEVLRDEGYGVRTAADGVEALHKILKDRPPPDVVVLDMGLPYLSGEGVIAALQKTEYAALPILLISAAPPSSLPIEVRRDYVFVRKSSRLDEELKEALRVVVQQRVGEWRARLRD